MNRAELLDWLTYHDAGFPGFADWFLNCESATLEQRIQLWLNRLSQFSHGQLSAQTDAMFGSLEKPQYNNQHLDWICMRLRPRPLLNQAEYGTAPRKCELCNDTGIVTVIFREQRFTPSGRALEGNTGPAACKCSKGRWLNDCRAKSPGGTELQMLDFAMMDLPQPMALSEAERREIEGRVAMKSRSLAAMLRKFSERVVKVRRGA